MYEASCCASGPGRAMQKLSAWRNRRSEIQLRRSTNSSCMIAICPAGPPKLMNPSFSQKRNAWPSVGFAGRVDSIQSFASAASVDIPSTLSCAGAATYAPVRPWRLGFPVNPNHGGILWRVRQ
jgi:hypothetical protein